MQPDPRLPPFVISLYNRAAGGDLCVRYEAYQVPAHGDLLIAHGGELTEGTPFQDHVMWRVDSVVWSVSMPGSGNAREWDRQRGLPAGSGCCRRVDLMVWPDMGPHWAESPPWAYSRHDEDEGDDDAA